MRLNVFETLKFTSLNDGHGDQGQQESAHADNQEQLAAKIMGNCPMLSRSVARGGVGEAHSSRKIVQRESANGTESISGHEDIDASSLVLAHKGVVLPRFHGPTNKRLRSYQLVRESGAR